MGSNISKWIRKGNQAATTKEHRRFTVKKERLNSRGGETRGCRRESASALITSPLYTEGVNKVESEVFFQEVEKKGGPECAGEKKAP